MLAAAVGPGEVADAWRRWRGATARAGELERLERAVEDAQREVSRVARWLEALEGEETGVRGEIATLRREIGRLEADGKAAHERAGALSAAALGLDVERARVGATPTLEADAVAVAAERAAAETDARRFEAGARQLLAVLEVGGEVLSWCARLRAGLEAVHADGTAALDALDLRLGQLAAEARAADLAATVATNLEGLRTEIGRVHVRAHAGADDIVRHLDRLAEAPDLLAPVEPERRAAEAELADLDRRAR